MARPAGIKIGDVFTTTKHGEVLVVEYHNTSKIMVSFINKTPPEYKWVIANSLRSGYVAPDSSYYRVGDILRLKDDSSVEIVEFIDYDHIKVSPCGYDNMLPVATSIGVLLKGHFKNPMKPLICGVGYFGQGAATAKDNNEESTFVYNCWGSMMHRCYNPKSKNYNIYGLRGVTVCDDWHNFQNFARWYLAQDHNSERGWQIDKDLTKFGNKVYTARSCAIVPAAINSLLTVNLSQEKELPTGVYYESNCNKFRSKSPKESKLSRDTFVNIEDAINNYLVHKSQIIKDILDLYSKDIPTIVMKNLELLDLKHFIMNKELKITGFNTVKMVLDSYYSELRS